MSLPGFLFATFMMEDQTKREGHDSKIFIELTILETPPYWFPQSDW